MNGHLRRRGERRWLHVMVDTALVLTVLGVVAIPALHHRGGSGETQAPAPATVEVRLTDERAVLVDDHPIDRQELVGHLRALQDEPRAGRHLVVRAERGVRFDRVRSVLLACDGLGFETVSLRSDER